MRDATKIKEVKFYIDGKETRASETWLTEHGEVFDSLKHNGCEMNVKATDIEKYLKRKEDDDNT